jgi:hypothetical protein
MCPGKDLRHLAKLYYWGDQPLQALHLRPTVGGFRLPAFAHLGVCAGSQLSGKAAADVLAHHPATNFATPCVVTLAALSPLPRHSSYETGVAEKR